MRCVQSGHPGAAADETAAWIFSDYRGGGLGLARRSRPSQTVAIAGRSPPAALVGGGPQRRRGASGSWSWSPAGDEADRGRAVLAGLDGWTAGGRRRDSRPVGAVRPGGAGRAGGDEAGSDPRRRPAVPDRADPCNAALLEALAEAEGVSSRPARGRYAEAPGGRGAGDHGVPRKPVARPDPAGVSPRRSARGLRRMAERGRRTDRRRRRGRAGRRPHRAGPGRSHANEADLSGGFRHGRGPGRPAGSPR